jgi:hypothetical protein
VQEDKPVDQNPDTDAATAESKPEEKPRTHVRAGITTNKGHGTPKARRQMAKASRKQNRRNSRR